MKRFSEIRLNSQEKKAIKAFSRRLRKELGKDLVSIKLFGSKARGDAHKDSDIDVLVLIRKHTIDSLKVVARVVSDVWWDYDVLLSTVTYDLEEEERNVAMGSFLFEEVKTQGVEI